MCKCDVSSQCREPEFCRCRFIGWPLNQEPLLCNCFPRSIAIVRGTDPNTGEARGENLVRAVAPMNCPPAALWQLERKLFDTNRWAFVASSTRIRCRRRGKRVWRPNGVRCLHAGDILEL